MSQNDFIINNQGFPATRSDINSALQALASSSSGTSEPPVTYPNQPWYDETNNILKMRNSANNGWIDLATFDQVGDTASFVKATAADKGIYSTAVNTFAEFDLTAFARTFLDDANASEVRTTLGLGKRTHQVFFDVDNTVYSTTSTTSFAAPSGTFSITPSDTGTRLIGIVVLAGRSEGPSGTGDASIRARLEYYNGSAYQGILSRTGAEQRVGGPTTGAFSAFAVGTMAFPFSLPEAYQRSDNGDWTVRASFDAFYPGSTAFVEAMTILALEVDA